MCGPETDFRTQIQQKKNIAAARVDKLPIHRPNLITHFIWYIEKEKGMILKLCSLIEY